MPELRFKGHDRQEFSEWESIVLKDIAKRVKNKNKENNKNVLTISAQQGLINQEEYFNKSVAAKDLTNYYLLNKGDFAYNKSYSNGYPMGAIKCLNRYEKGVVSTLYICFKFHEKYNNSFFEQYFETGLHNKEIEKVAQEGARNHGLLNIGLKDFFNIELTIPSVEEQNKIVSFLKAVDEKITQLTQKYGLLTQYKKGVMQQIFSQEFRFKDDDGCDFPEWEEKTIEQIADVKGGKRLAKGYSLQSMNNGKPYITVTDMYEGGVEVENIRYVPIEIAESIKNYKIGINDIFISVAGTLGIVGIVPEELNNANLTENANKLTNLKCNQKYLLQYLMSDNFKILIDSVKTTNAQPKLAIYAIKSFAIYMPTSTSEQTKIANFLTSLDDKITNTKTQLRAVKQYKQGLLQQMFV